MRKRRSREDVNRTLRAEIPEPVVDEDLVARLAQVATTSAPASAVPRRVRRAGAAVVLSGAVLLAGLGGAYGTGAVRAPWQDDPIPPRPAPTAPAPSGPGTPDPSAPSTPQDEVSGGSPTQAAQSPSPSPSTSASVKPVPTLRPETTPSARPPSPSSTPTPTVAPSTPTSTSTRTPSSAPRPPSVTPSTTTAPRPSPSSPSARATRPAGSASPAGVTTAPG